MNLDNQIIANYLYFTATDQGWHDTKGIFKDSNLIKSSTFKEYELLFNVSWDWLMPVYRFIKDTGPKCDEEGFGKLEKISEAVESCDLNMAYDSIIDYIKWDSQVPRDGNDCRIFEGIEVNAIDTYGDSFAAQVVAIISVYLILVRDDNGNYFNFHPNEVYVA